MPGRSAPIVALAGLLTAAGCSPHEPFVLPDEVLQEARGIVGGTETREWDQVGMYIIDGGAGGVCTATLVHSNWLLTAGHCAEEAGSDDYFFVGYDADEIGFGDLKSIKEAYVHPSYDMSESHPHDVALLELHGPLSGVDPIPVNETGLTDDWIGVWLHFVGFGSDTYYGGPGAGLKRETDLRIFDYTSLEILTYTEGTSTCTGDSGGPAFVDRDGYLYHAGVISGGFPLEAGQDACEGASYEMRVDAEMNFIDNHFDPDEVEPFETPEWGPEEETDDDDDTGIDLESLPEPRVDEDDYEPLGGWDCDVSGSTRTPAALAALVLLIAGVLVRRRNTN